MGDCAAGNDSTALARRYHWHSAQVRDFTAEPHTAIVGEHQGTIMNLVDRQARPVQKTMLAMVAEQPEKKTLSEARRLSMPAHHDVRPSAGGRLSRGGRARKCDFGGTQWAQRIR